MTTEDDFIAAVCAEPDDDNLRLVFADWLQEHGQEHRAEFVRAQIKAATEGVGRCYSRLRVPGAHWTYTFPKMVAARPWEIHPHGHFVSPFLVLSGKRYPANYATCVVWHRGFPAIVSCTERQWHRHHHQFPGPVEEVRLSRTSGSWGVWTANGRRGFSSLVCPSVSVEAEYLDTARLKAFPNVLRFATSPCTAARLLWLSTHGFDAPAREAA